MATAIEDILGDRISAGHVVVKYEHVLPTQTIILYEAGHPVPDEAGVRGTQQMMRLLKSATEEDLVLCLISGGGSALMIAPAEGISLEHMQTMTTLLLSCGATINEINVVRKHLSSELGFSKEHRNINILRIGFVASEITKNGGIAICAPIAPYRTTRQEVREMIAGAGGFVEVYVSTSLEVCEERDRKGLYAKARAGLIKEFTGISDPYEIPDSPEMVIDTSAYSPDEAAHRVILKLESMGFIKGR